MDIKVFRLINNLAYNNGFLDEIMVICSKYVPYLFMVLIVFVFILGISKKNLSYRKTAFSTVILTLINLFLSFIIGNIYYVDRPFVHNKVNLLLQHVKDASLPSDHAVGTMSVALGLEKYNKTVSILLKILSVIVGFSRIYVGHHYPLDILMAYLITFVTTYLYNIKVRNIIERVYEVIEEKVLDFKHYNVIRK